MSDNKHYRGKIDRIRVAFGEEYELDYFVKHYIQSRGYSATPKNQELLQLHLDRYPHPHSGTVMRDQLTQWLDARIPKGWVHSAIPDPKD